MQPQQKETPCYRRDKRARTSKKSPAGAKEKPRPQSQHRSRCQRRTIKKPAAQRQHLLLEESKKPDGPVYTVQIGAFKSSAEAETFRKKHAKNELKTYITTATNKKKEKIYKVRTGEFKDKKSAEVLSLKLSKTEKLKTFVTLKNE